MATPYQWLEEAGMTAGDPFSTSESGTTVDQFGRPLSWGQINPDAPGYGMDVERVEQIGENTKRIFFRDGTHQDSEISTGGRGGFAGALGDITKYGSLATLLALGGYAALGGAGAGAGMGADLTGTAGFSPEMVSGLSGAELAGTGGFTASSGETGLTEIIKKIGKNYAKNVAKNALKNALMPGGTSGRKQQMMGGITLR